MSLAQKVESAVQRLASDAEKGVEAVDGQALADARRAVAAVRAAEAKGARLAVRYRDLIESVAKDAPGVRAALTTIATQLAEDFAALFAG